MIKKFTDTSPATASSANSSIIIGGLDSFDAMQIVTVFTGATGGDLDIYLQMADDRDSATWFDYAHWTVTAGAAVSTKLYTVSRQKDRVTGITIGMDERADRMASLATLAAGTVLGGDFGAKMRVRWTAGVGTSAGAAQTIYFFGSPAKFRV